ncbi:MAG: hypothetical protein AAF806_29925, partial [Bacteroidota bacterium]
MIKFSPHSAATHSSLDLFESPNVLVNFKHANWEEVQPLTGVDGPTIEFAVRTDREVFLDLTKVELHLELKITRADGAATDATDTKVTFAKNAMHALFSNCDVFLNNELVSSANGLYAHKTFVSKE